MQLQRSTMSVSPFMIINQNPMRHTSYVVLKLQAGLLPHGSINTSNVALAIRMRNHSLEVLQRRLRIPEPHSRLLAKPQRIRRILHPQVDIGQWLILPIGPLHHAIGVDTKRAPKHHIHKLLHSLGAHVGLLGERQRLAQLRDGGGDERVAHDLGRFRLAVRLVLERNHGAREHADEIRPQAVEGGFRPGRDAEQRAGGRGGRRADDGAGDVGGAGGGEERAEGVGGGGEDGLAADKELAGDGRGGEDVAVGVFDGGVVGEAGEDDVGLGYAVGEGVDHGCLAWGQLSGEALGACCGAVVEEERLVQSTPFHEALTASLRYHNQICRVLGLECLTYTSNVAQPDPHQLRSHDKCMCDVYSGARLDEQSSNSILDQLFDIYIDIYRYIYIYTYICISSNRLGLTLWLSDAGINHTMHRKRRCVKWPPQLPDFQLNARLHAVYLSSLTKFPKQDFALEDQ